MGLKRPYLDFIPHAADWTRVGDSRRWLPQNLVRTFTRKLGWLQTHPAAHDTLQSRDAGPHVQAGVRRMPRFPLTPIEHYFFTDDQPAYPCWVVLRFRLRGRLRREWLEAAWRDTVRRHPTLHSVIQRDGADDLYWEAAPAGHEPQFHWHRAPEVAAATRWTALDPAREPAVRLVVAEGAGTCELSLEGHHAVFDGTAGYQVFHDVLVHYARAAGVDLAPPALHEEKFAQRGRFRLGWGARLRHAPVQALGLWYAWQMQRRTIAPLTAAPLADAAGPAPAGFPALLHQALPAADFVRLRAVAKAHGATLNDLLLRDLQAAIGVWRMREGVGTADDWIVIAIPVGLRRTDDAGLPAANVIGIVALDRRARSLHNRSRLLRRAHEDMTLVKRHQLGFTFLHLLAWWRRRRGGIARYCHAPVSRATAVLTNLGQPFQASPLLDPTQRVAVPGAVLEDFALAAPCRRGTGASVAVALYAGRLLVDLHYDPRMLNDRQAETFLAAFFEQLYTSIAEAGRPINQR